MYNIVLREFGASVCFYWNLAELLDRSDWSTVRDLQKIEITKQGEKKDAVTALPFSAYGMDWKFLAGLDRHKTPVSTLLAAKFVAEARDISLGEARADELFDNAEIAIALGYADKRAALPGSFGMPIGRFIWNRNGERLEAELKRIEGLPDSDVFFKAGMLGGSQANAAPILQKIRQFYLSIASQGW